MQWEHHWQLPWSGLFSFLIGQSGQKRIFKVKVFKGTPDIYLFCRPGQYKHYIIHHTSCNLTSRHPPNQTKPMAKTFTNYNQNYNRSCKCPKVQANGENYCPPTLVFGNKKLCGKPLLFDFAFNQATQHSMASNQQSGTLSFGLCSRTIVDPQCVLCRYVAVTENQRPCPPRIRQVIKIVF